MWQPNKKVIFVVCLQRLPSNIFLPKRIASIYTIKPQIRLFGFLRRLVLRTFYGCQYSISSGLLLPTFLQMENITHMPFLMRRSLWQSCSAVKFRSLTHCDSLHRFGTRQNQKFGQKDHLLLNTALRQLLLMTFYLILHYFTIVYN